MRPPRLLHDDTVTILKVAGGAGEGEGDQLPIDADGVPITHTTEHEWTGVNVQASSTQEFDDNRETVVTYFRVSGPVPPVTITASDRIRWHGIVHEIVGDPDVRTGYGRINHCSLTMRASRG